MCPSQDEIWEWAVRLSRKYGYHPMKFIGDLEVFSWDGYTNGMKRIKKRMEEVENDKKI